MVDEEREHEGASPAPPAESKSELPAESTELAAAEPHSELAPATAEAAGPPVGAPPALPDDPQQFARAVGANPNASGMGQKVAASFLTFIVMVMVAVASIYFAEKMVGTTKELMAAMAYWTLGALGVRALLLMLSGKTFYGAACASVAFSYFGLMGGLLYEWSSRELFDRVLRHAFGHDMPGMLVPWLTYSSVGIGGFALARTLFGGRGRWPAITALAVSGVSLLGMAWWFLRSMNHGAKFLAREGCRRVDAPLSCQTYELRYNAELAEQATATWILLAMSVCVVLLAVAALHQLDVERERIVQYAGFIWGAPAVLVLLFTFSVGSGSALRGGAVDQVAQLHAQGQRESACRGLSQLLEGVESLSGEQTPGLNERLPSWRALAASCVEQYAPSSQSGTAIRREDWVCSLARRVNYRSGDVRCY